MPEAGPEPDPDTRVRLAQGEVAGFSRDGAHLWLGLPYAEPPEGALRWRAPRPPRPHEGVLEATTFGDVCPQIGTPLGGAPADVTGELWGREDCLYLNVYAPAGERRDLPVMFWIHGGGNTVGHSGFYDGATLAARHEVIVVTANYRLGPLGWLHHPALAGADAEDASGNYGTLDLIRALEWTRRNIAAFGGDPEAVTLFGESAGATNVASLAVSPRARGLFRGAIMQSGGTSSTSAARASHYRDDPDIPGHPASSGELLLRVLSGPECDRTCAREHADGMTPAQQEAALRALTVAELFELYAGEMSLLGPNSPTVIRDGAVLPATPFIELFGDPMRSASVPMILGTNRDEPRIFMAFDPDQVVRLAGVPLWRRDPALYELRSEYGALAWKLRGVDAPARRLHDGGVPVWTYRWDWDEEGSFLGIDLSALLGASHGLEIPFVFGHFELGPRTPLLFHDDNAEGRIALSERMMAYWAAFARDLDPGNGADGAGPRWHPWDPAGGHTFVRLDTGAGGIAMEDQELDMKGLIERLMSDDRFESDAQRCRVLATSIRSDDERIDAAKQELQCGAPET